MIDPLQLVRQWLLASDAVQAIAGLDVFNEVMPEHYDPTSNPCVVCTIKGGAGHAEIAPMAEVEIQVKCWAGINQFVLGRSLYGAVYDTVHSKSMVTFSGFGTVLTSYEISAMQTTPDPDTGWATVTGAFHMKMRQDSPGTLPTYVDHTQSLQEYIDGFITGVDDDV